jgi:hypothetical protein
MAQNSPRPLKRPKARKRDQPTYQRTRSNAKLFYEAAVLTSIPESVRITGLGLSLTYKMVREGTMPSVLVNGRRYIHIPRLMEWLDSLGGTAA